MSIKPIIFSAPMVRALLAGTKTQTRRLCAWANNPNSPQLTYIVACDEAGWFGDEEGEVQFTVPYVPGDKLYVREACAIDGPRVWYRVDHEEAEARGPRVDVRWRPSIHMPRSASRLWLTVTDVRVQRLQDISEADAIAEGIEPGRNPDTGEVAGWRDYETIQQGKHKGITHPHAILPYSEAWRSYSSLWDELHRDEGTRWADNPWVVAYTFTVHEGNVDAAS